jgi:hypothetical protein
MTRSIVLLFSILSSYLCVQGMSREQADSLSLAAQQAYAAGDHQGALVLFDSVNTHYSSAGLLYNIGNCYFKSQDIPRAILYYERALRRAPGDPDIAANLELARQHIMDRVAEMPSFSLAGSIARVAGGGDPDRWSRRAVGSWILCLILLGFAWGLSSRNVLRKIVAVLGGIALIVTLSSIGLAVFEHTRIHAADEGVIMAPRLDVRSEPREGGTTLFVLHKGTTVSILQQVDDWMEISLRNGNVGWIPMGTLEII